MKKLIYLLFALLPLCSLANTADQVDSIPDAEPKVWVYNSQGQLIAKGLLQDINKESVGILLRRSWQRRLNSEEAYYEMPINQIGYIKVLDNPDRKKLLARNVAANYVAGFGGGGLAGLAYAAYGSHSLWVFAFFAYPPVFALAIGTSCIVTGLLYINFRIRHGKVNKYNAADITPQILD